MHGLTDDILKSYATGTTSAGLALLISAQMTARADSRARVAGFESVAAALMAEDAPAEMSEGALSAVLDRLDAPDPGGSRAPDPGPLPEPVIRAVGRDFDRIPWRFRLPGVSDYVLDGFPAEQVSLLRARPGASVPQHTHEGQEATLILTGAMEDGGRVLGPGDVAINDEHDDHKPRIIGTGICHCLIVMTGSLRFTGRFGRALNLLAE